MARAKAKRPPSPTDSGNTALGLLSAAVDRAVNRTAHPGRLPASAAALELHRRGPIVDLLAGSVLFRNTFLEPGGRGQVDLPRLRAAGVNVVGLTVATRFPDLRGTLSYFHFRSLGAPRSVLRSNMALAEWLIARIDAWCAGSAGQLSVIRTRADLEARIGPNGHVGVLLNVQGGHVLDGDVGKVARLRQLGVRMVAPAHLMDNELVGSGTGRRAGGLSGYGREVLAELEAQAMLVDLAHMSSTGVEAALPLLKRPFAISHTGLTEVAGGGSRWRRYGPATRNVPAALAAEVGRRGGLVGVVLATQLVGGDELGDVVRTIRATLAAAGDSGVGIGSDMDGALRTVIDVAGLPALTSALLAGGVDPTVVGGVMGGNAVEFLRRGLPTA
jgi:microsomal dipeptidase-like Zn-dependent dipeptidase